MHDFPDYRAFICVAAIALSLLTMLMVGVLGIVVIVTISPVCIFVLVAADVAG